MNPSPASELDSAGLDDPHQHTRPPRSPEHERLHVSFKHDRHYLQQMIALESSKRSERVEAIMTLKDSIDKSSSVIQSQNALRHRKARDIDEQDARRFDEILAQGLNPYEVARKRTVRKIADNERRKIEANIQDKQMAILKHLEVEKVWMQRQERIAAEQRAYEKKYQKEMGRTAVEERTKQYLLSRTGRETMDPTGKAFRLYPSQETSIKDRSFGLGKNLVHDAQQRHVIVDKVRRKRIHHNSMDAEPNPILLPRLGGRGKNNNDIDRTNSPPIQLRCDETVTPGQELEELNHFPVATTSIPPSALIDSATKTKEEMVKLKKGFGKPHRSVLEQRMLEQAREKQKSNIFQKQVVWGKEFTGRAFLADPPEIWFKDFEVGVPLTLSFTLTNVSNTFNHFKLLELGKSLREYFDIKYEKPGRMSAGMSCRIAITFTAVQARDIDGMLPAIAQTGPFSIPLLCTCKKAVPVMTTRCLVFKDVATGGKQVLALRLENHGALPFDFRLRRIRNAIDEPRPESNDDEGGDSKLDGETDGPPDVMINETTRREYSASSPLEATVEPADEFRAETEIEKPSEFHDDVSQRRVLEPMETLSTSSSTLSIASGTFAPILVPEHLPLSAEEETILARARASTVYKPEGADTPLRHTTNGTVAAYASAVITFTFAPSSPVTIDEQFLVEFPDANTQFRTSFWAPQILTPIPVSVSAQSTQVPIFIEQPEINFRCCLYDRLYRQQLVVRNRGSVALKMQIRVPKVLDGSVEFHPNMGFVQGASSAGDPGTFPVQIKFRPNVEMWKRLQPKFLGEETLGFLAVPVQIIVPDQVVPVYCIVYGRITPAVLSFSQKRLDFGSCVLGHSVIHTLKVTNTSRLPQRIAFVKLPPELRLETPRTSANTADDGIATLLPGEEKPFSVVYQPNASATTLSGRLICRSTNRDEYSIPVTGECVASPLTFSHSVVQFATTQVGQMQVFSIACTNNSDRPQTMELIAPPESAQFLRVTPTVATLSPRTSIRVEIQYKADEEIFRVESGEYRTCDADTTLRTSPAFSVLTNRSNDDNTKVQPKMGLIGEGLPTRPMWMQENGVLGEDRSVHHTWTVLCFRKQSPTVPACGDLVAFQVRTTATDSRLLATPQNLDFGQVAIGQTLVHELKFTNRSAHDVVLFAKPLHALGSFRIINSIHRPISARGGTRIVKMEFRPSAPLLYDDELELSCPELGVIRVALRGEGVNPSLRIQPEDGVLDFRDVLARTRSTCELLLTNASTFPLSLAIIPLLVDGSAVPVSSSGLPVFTFSPNEATIPAQATLAVKVLFFPDHQRPQHYSNQYLIQVPNESERHVLTLSGRCWENQVYVFNPHQPAKLFAAPPVEDLLDVPPSVNLSSLLGPAGSAQSLFNAALSVPGIKKAPAPLTIVFESEAAVSETKTIFVGSTLAPSSDDDPSAPKAGGTPSGTFEFTIEENLERPQYAKLFTLEPMRGSVSAAQQVPIQITFQNTTQATSSGTDESLAAHPELVVSQWIQVRVSCSLRGGALWRPLPSVAVSPVAPVAAPNSKSAAPAPVAGESDSRTVHLVLRTKMRSC